MGRHATVFFCIAVVLGVVVAGGCGDDSGSEVSPSATAGDEGVSGVMELCAGESSPEPDLLEVGVVSELPDEGNDHVFCPTYDRRPPASGDHLAAWQNCGFYTVPVQDQTAVHALEHGAVWIAYAPDLAADEVAAIEVRTAGAAHLLAAPYPGLQNPIVMTAWQRQLALDSTDDPLFEEFIDAHEARKSPTAPEAGASCAGAVGAPPDDPNAGFAAIVEQVVG